MKNIRDVLKEVLDNEGTIRIPMANIISQDDDGVVVRLASREVLTMKLMSLASGKGDIAFKAGKFLFEQDAGKADQKIEIELPQLPRFLPREDDLFLDIKELLIFVPKKELRLIIRKLIGYYKKHTKIEDGVIVDNLGKLKEIQKYVDEV